MTSVMILSKQRNHKQMCQNKKQHTHNEKKEKKSNTNLYEINQDFSV